MSKDLWPSDVRDAAAKMGGNWLKAEMFEGEGMVLTIKSVEKVKSTNPKYGAVATDYLYKNEVLELGETFHFIFVDSEGKEKMIDSKSSPLFIAMQQAQIEAGDTIHIKREGESEKTRYYVSKRENGLTNEDKADKLTGEDSPF